MWVDCLNPSYEDFVYIWFYFDISLWVSILTSNVVLQPTQLAYLFAQSQFWEHQNVLNLLKVNNKDARTKSMTLFWCFYCQCWTGFTDISSVSIVDF